MKERQVDARGKPCPQPVLLAREAILAPDAALVRVTVDDAVACENVQRLARSQGWESRTEEHGETTGIILSKGNGAKDPALERQALACGVDPQSVKVVVLVASDQFGSGSEELGRILMRAFVKTIKELKPAPTMLIFANAGVRLSTEGSDLIEDLQALAARGMEVLSCGTCLDYFKLKESLRVGRVSNMYEIASALVGADRVVRP